MGLNDNMHKARVIKNDEFYTQLPDIENELKHYKEHFKDKIVYCNCDNEDSNFIKYFKDNFKELRLKELLYTGLPIDFRSNESIELLKRADVVVTNPPFSLFREYMAQLIEYENKFLVIGHINAITYKDVFKHIMSKRVWLGINSRNMDFKLLDGSIFPVTVRWFTNLKHNKQNEELILTKKYNEKDYPKYDNYNAIEVSKVANIPVDYEGVMGVPITFLSKYNPEQFELLGCSYEHGRIDEHITGAPFKTRINGKQTFKRLFIRRRK